MRSGLSTCALLLLLTPLGCANYSNSSKVKDPESFPPGRYGLYESKSGQLILTYELKTGETFGFEYVEHPGATAARPTALTIDRGTGRPDGSMTVWRVPLKPTEYEWRALTAPAASVPAAVVTAP